MDVEELVAGLVIVHWLPLAVLFSMIGEEDVPVMVKLPSVAIVWVSPPAKLRITPGVVQLKLSNVFSAARVVFAVKFAVVKVLLPVRLAPVPEKFAI